MSKIESLTLLQLLAALSLSAQQLGPAPKGPMKYTRPPDLENVSYGPHERQVLDLWKAKSKSPTPLVVYFHPGGFNHGDKTWIEWLDKPMLELCLSRGISVATVNYRYCDRQVHLPEPMLDGVLAIQYLRFRAAEWNLNPKAVAAAGGSAGAGMSMWIGFHDDLADPHSPDPIRRQSTRIPVVGSIDGQSSYDPRVIAKLIDEGLASHPVFAVLFGVQGDARKATGLFPLFEEGSAITYLTKDDPPVFLYYTHNVNPLPPANQNEAMHNPRFGIMLKEQMDKLRIECVFRTPKDYEDRSARPFTGEMVDFFQKYFPRE
jgi:acetyl esterase/lipase